MKRALLIIGGTVGGLGAVLSITPPQLGSANPGAVTALGTGSNSLGSTTQSTPAAPQTTTPSSAPASSSTTATSPSVKTTPTAVTSPPFNQTTTPTVKKKPMTAPVAHTTTKAPTKPASTTPSQTPSQTSTPTASTTPSQTPSQTPTPTPTKTTPPPPPVSAGISGTFTGASYDANQSGRIWGRVTVTVTLNNGAISNINAVQSPSSRSYNAFSALTPAVVGQMTPKNVMAISPSSLFAQVSGRTGASYSAQAYWESLQSALSKAGV